MPDSPSDKVKLSIYTSTKGVWRLIVSRAAAQEFSEKWKEPAGEYVGIKGRLNDLDSNRIEMEWRKIIVTGLDIVEVNQEF